MRIAYVGNFEHSWCSEVHVAASFETLGHTVHRVQENRIETFAQALGDIGMENDLVLYQRTWGFPGAAAAWEHYATNDIPTATFSLDLYANISRRQMVVDGDPMFKTKYLFSADGSPEAQAFFEAHGVQHFWIKPGMYDKEAYLAEPDPAYNQFAVGFVGSSGGEYYHREWPWRTELLDFLRRVYNDKFIKVGHPDNVVRGSELNVLYASVPVFVGDTLCPGFNYPNYFSDRAYETLGRGGFLIHPHVPGLEAEFEDFTHLLFYEYGDFDGIRDRIQWAVDHPAEREKIRLAGHEYVKNNCTYVHRMREMLAIVGREEGWDVDSR